MVRSCEGHGNSNSVITGVFEKPLLFSFSRASLRIIKIGVAASEEQVQREEEDCRGSQLVLLPPAPAHAASNLPPGLAGRRGCRGFSVGGRGCWGRMRPLKSRGTVEAPIRGSRGSDTGQRRRQRGSESDCTGPMSSASRTQICLPQAPVPVLAPLPSGKIRNFLRGSEQSL